MKKSFLYKKTKSVAIMKPQHVFVIYLMRSKCWCNE